MIQTLPQVPEVLNAEENPSEKGQWGDLFDLPNVGVHACLLPNEKVLFLPRRLKPGEGDLDVRECQPFLWDPASGAITETPQPTLEDGTNVNLFCSGHAFLADGRLLVMGGHFLDGYGLNQATIYDYRTNTWTATANMGEGDNFLRWYPTATTLPNGSVLVFSGSTRPGEQNSDAVQIWENDNWTTITEFIAPELYPRMMVAPDGRAFMAGPATLTQFLNTETGEWQPLGDRQNGLRDYAPSIMYADINTREGGKVIYIGGGNPPTNAAEVIDLNDDQPAWRSVEPMKFPRRQHNAVVLPDGQICVFGGTQGNGFNDLTDGQPVHVAELWDPVTETWTELLAEDIDRCYHSTTVLLPDATILSTGGGEFAVDYQNQKAIVANDPADSHANAQIFSPPYLFRGPRPDILTAPDEVTYGEVFEVGTSTPEDIKYVSWIRLAAITHAFNHSQGINFLSVSVEAQKLMVTAPPNANVCPPGHYMMFVLTEDKVPSIAKIIKIDGEQTSGLTDAFMAFSVTPSVPEMSCTEKCDRDITEADKGTLVEVGLTATCPYGLGACWGGAYAALQQMQNVQFVRPVANAEDSTAYVYLSDDGLPDIEQWQADLARSANESYKFRGVEVTLTGTIAEQDGTFILLESESRPPVFLMALEGTEKIQWDRSTRSPKPLEGDESLAYQQLISQVRDGEMLSWQIIGPLKKNGDRFELYVRAFSGEDV